MVQSSLLLWVVTILSVSFSTTAVQGSTLRVSGRPKEKPTSLNLPRETNSTPTSSTEARGDVRTPPLPPADNDNDTASSDDLDKADVCVAITGGAGQIAYSLIPLIIHGRVFGEGRKVRLRLLDIKPCMGALEGVAMEVLDCFSDLVSEVVTTSDPEVAFEGADVAILLGGFPRLQGMERRELIAKNVPIMAEHGKALAKCASSGVRVLVVANPACTNCLVNNHQQQYQQQQRVLSSNTDIRGVYLWGNHSPTMWPDVSRAEAKVGYGSWESVETALLAAPGRKVEGAKESSTAWRDGVSTSLVTAVRERGSKVIKARGKSSALSAANAIAKHLKDWLASPCPDEGSEGQTAAVGVSMGVFSDGNPYGVPNGLFFSFPVQCGRGRYCIMEGFSPDRAMLEASTQELIEEKQEAFEILGEMGLLDSLQQ